MPAGAHPRSWPACLFTKLSVLPTVLPGTPCIPFCPPSHLAVSHRHLLHHGVQPVLEERMQLLGLPLAALHSFVLQRPAAVPLLLKSRLTPDDIRELRG